jgi:hypothetical protein
MATKTKKKPAPKTKPKAHTGTPKPKTGKSNQHCKKCGESGHNSRRHKVIPLAKVKPPVKAKAKK